MSWHEVLKREVARSSVKAVADRIGYARTSVSLALHGRYPGRIDMMAAKIIETFEGQVACPHLGEEISPEKCARISCGPMPTSHRGDFRHWTACQSCPLKPEGSTS